MISAAASSRVLLNGISRFAIVHDNEVHPASCLMQGNVITIICIIDYIYILLYML
jgi:hypothetical protein